MFALLVVGGLWGAADFFHKSLRMSAPQKSPLEKIAWFYVLLFIMATSLATRAWIKSIFVEWTIILVILWFNFCSMKSTIQGLKDFRLFHQKPMTMLYAVIGTVLVVDFFYASLPLYRYDQWTYHLVIAKWISKMGSLTPPVTYDPIFFTGSYEFMGLLARAISGSDTFQQGFQNSLSWLLVVFPAVALFRTSQERSGPWLVGGLAFATFCIFGPVDHEAVINAKPDYVLMMIALVLMISAQGGRLALSPWLVGFLLVAGAGFKLTWIHFSLCTPVIIWGTFGRNLKNKIPAILGGSISALLCLGPWTLKNWLYFKNPFHPVQSRFFKSSIWGPQLSEYWHDIAKKPETVIDFMANMLQIIASLPGRWMIAEIAIIFAAIVTWRSKTNQDLTENTDKQAPRPRWDIILGCFVSYLCTWGFFYGAGISSRFVSSAFSFVLVLVWLLIPRLMSQPRLTKISLMLMLLPALAYSQLEVSTWHLLEAARKTFNQISLDDPSPLGKVPDLLSISEHRQTNFPDASYTEATLLSDFGYNYYGPSAFWPAFEPIFWWHLDHAGFDSKNGDGLAFLRKLNIRYVWIVNSDHFKQLPPAITSVVEQLKPLPSRQGKLYLIE
jgi:hypothetical protein